MEVLPTKETARDSDTLLKGKCTKFICSHLLWTLVEGGQRQLEWCDILGLVDQWRELKDPCAQSFLILKKPSFSGRAFPSMWHQPGRKQ